MGRILSSPLQYGASESGDPTEQPGDWRYIRITDITLDGKLKNEGQKYLPKDIAELYPLEKGDLLFARSGATVGKSYLFNESINACFAGYLIKARINKDIALPEYVSHFTKSAQYDEWKNRIFIQATIQNIGADKYSRLYVPLPPMSEQHAIVSYLDDKCEKIEEWLDKKQKEVEHLHELKQRVIADAVTRGLNPNVTMKQTNIPWLPEVPEHWECIKMKYLFNERSEKNHPDEVSLCATQTYGVIPQKLYCSYGNRVVEVSKGFELLKFVKEGDFVIHLRSFQGGIEYAYYQGIISPAYTILEPKDANNSPYLKFLFKSYNFIQLLKTCVTGIREGQNINYSMLGNKYLFIPPLEEQKQIVSHITDKTSKIEKLIANINREIDGIKEYKQRLISDVVTGQIKV